MFLQDSKKKFNIKCLEDKNIDFKYTQIFFRPTDLGFFKSNP
jgi:hypothetical protein